MLKNILKLDGAQKLSKNEQKNINGGNPKPFPCNKNCGYDTGGIRICSC